jgi:hypothetical protein
MENCWNTRSKDNRAEQKSVWSQHDTGTPVDMVSIQYTSNEKAGRVLAFAPIYINTSHIPIEIMYNAVLSSSRASLEATTKYSARSSCRVRGNTATCTLTCSEVPQLIGQK